MALRLLAAVFLLAGCGQEPAPVPEAKREEARPALAAEAPAPPEAPAPAPPASDSGPAEVLKRYYALIGQGRYADAYRLREGREGAASEAAFAESYGRYAEYRATVGTPSLPVAAGGWLYVEVPVQMYGRTKSGEPMASAGTMTLRRRTSEPNAPWRIYTTR